jgi:hypothetical protein
MDQHTAHFEWRIRDTFTQEETKFDSEEFLYWQFSTSRYYCGIKKVKVKCSRYRPGVAQRVDRDIALLFHDRGTRRR